MKIIQGWALSRVLTLGETWVDFQHMRVLVQSIKNPAFKYEKKWLYYHLSANLNN